MNGNRWSQRLWRWTLLEKRHKGKPARDWIQDMMSEAMETRNLTENYWQDRIRWGLGCKNWL